MKEDLQKELDEFRAKGLARSLRQRDTVNLVNFSSNDYLGLTTHPAVLSSAATAMRQYGTGSGASRLLAGTISVHAELEKELAFFLSKDSALVFPSGYHVNTGVIPALAGSQDIIFFDRLSHASIIDGIRLSTAPFAAYKHNDLNDLEDLLKNRRSKARRAIIVTEGFFSMDGDRPPLADIVRLARTYDAWVYLDEAHSLGLAGPKGRGLAAEENLLDQIDIHVGTLSKTLASQGGFVAGSKALIDFLITRCRSFAYTTALAPANAAAALAALWLVPTLDAERSSLFRASDKARTQLVEMGFNVSRGRSPIVPVLTGSVEATKNLSDYLLSQGFFVPSIRPPTVPIGEGRVRLSISTPVIDKIDALMRAFEGGRVATTA